jgi:hypothetical protein
MGIAPYKSRPISGDEIRSRRKPAHKLAKTPAMFCPACSDMFRDDLDFKKHWKEKHNKDVRRGK